MLHMLAQRWPNFKNLESLHSTVLYSKNTKKSLPFPFFGIFKMSIKAVMRRESFWFLCKHMQEVAFGSFYPKSEIPNANSL